MLFKKNPQIDPILTTLSDSFNEHELATLGTFGTVINLQAKSVLAKEGAVGKEAVVVISGEAKVVRDDKTIATVSSGSILGEGSLITGEARNASLIAETDLKVSVLNRREFNSWLAACPRVEAQVRELALSRAS